MGWHDKLPSTISVKAKTDNSIEIMYRCFGSSTIEVSDAEVKENFEKMGCSVEAGQKTDYRYITVPKTKWDTVKKYLKDNGVRFVERTKQANIIIDDLDIDKLDKMY